MADASDDGAETTSSLAPSPTEAAAAGAATAPATASAEAAAAAANVTVASLLPPRLASLFHFEAFNKVQSRCAGQLLGDDESMVVSSPTGSGKTVLMELAILRVFFYNETAGRYEVTLGETRNTRKVVYVAPIKALAYEKAKEWAAMLGPFGLRVKDVTGDSAGSNEEQLEGILGAHVVVTTPEKFDSVTRRWRERVVTACVQDIGLVLLDEVHLVAEERGAVLEALVSRMKTIRSAHSHHPRSRSLASSQLRFVAVSATLSNAVDFAEWVGAAPSHTKVFSNADRPVPLSVTFATFPDRANPFLFEKFLTYKVPQLIVEHGDGKPVLVFCHTRKGAAQTAQHLAQNLEVQPCVPGAAKEAAATLDNKALAECVSRGVGFHHAGLTPEDRHVVEQLFFRRAIMILSTTSTLALGVNLPARLVVIKGTSHYSNGKTVPLSMSMLMQMAGRAGRAGMDDRGKAVVMTTEQGRAGYQPQLHSTDPVESVLHKHAVEHLNAEVVLGTINCTSVAVEWLKTTFFWIRVHKNRAHYGFAGPGDLDGMLDEELADMLRHLVGAGCVALAPKEDSVDGDASLDPTPVGRSLAKYYLRFDSAVVMNRLVCRKMTLPSVLEMLSQCGDFAEIRLRMGEKKVLNLAHKSVRFPLTEGGSKLRHVTEHWHKAYLLVQMAVHDVPVEDWVLKNDQGRILSTLPRLLRHLIELGIAQGLCSPIVHAYNLTRCLERRVWYDGNVLKQFEGIGRTTALNLARAGIATVADVLAADSARIDQAAGRTAPFGINLRRRCFALPRFCLRIAVPTNGTGSITVTRIVEGTYGSGGDGSERVGCVLLACDEEDVLLCVRSIPREAVAEDAAAAAEVHTFEFPVPRAAQTRFLHAWIVNADYLGVDAHETLVLRGGGGGGGGGSSGSGSAAVGQEEEEEEDAASKTADDPHPAQQQQPRKPKPRARKQRTQRKAAATPPQPQADSSSSPPPTSASAADAGVSLPPPPPPPPPPRRPPRETLQELHLRTLGKLRAAAGADALPSPPPPQSPETQSAAAPAAPSKIPSPKSRPADVDFALRGADEEQRPTSDRGRRGLRTPLPDLAALREAKSAYAAAELGGGGGGGGGGGSSISSSDLTFLSSPPPPRRSDSLTPPPLTTPSPERGSGSSLAFTTPPPRHRQQNSLHDGAEASEEEAMSACSLLWESENAPALPSRSSSPQPRGGTPQRLSFDSCSEEEGVDVPATRAQQLQPPSAPLPSPPPPPTQAPPRRLGRRRLVLFPEDKPLPTQQQPLPPQQQQPLPPDSQPQSWPPSKRPRIEPCVAQQPAFGRSHADGSGGNGFVAELLQLKELLADGLLTREEFDAGKQKILGATRHATPAAAAPPASSCAFASAAAFAQPPPPAAAIVPLKEACEGAGDADALSSLFASASCPPQAPPLHRQPKQPKQQNQEQQQQHSQRDVICESTAPPGSGFSEPVHHRGLRIKPFGKQRELPQGNVVIPARPKADWGAKPHGGGGGGSGGGTPAGNGKRAPFDLRAPPASDTQVSYVDELLSQF